MINNISMDDQSSFGSKIRHDEADFNLKEWALKARISRENTNSRRFSASNFKSFRVEAADQERSFISSTASSPGYTIRDEIDPSTYSFTTALKALQAKTVYTWEYVSSSPDGRLKLNSKWNDAEKYICNPLSGQVPLECLSAKTLSARSFRSRITMSAPLIYPADNSNHLIQPKAPIGLQHYNQLKITIQAAAAAEQQRSTTRDVGTQSTPVRVRSSSPSPVQTPSIEERPIKRCEAEDSSDDSNGKIKSEAQVQVKEKQYTKRNEGKSERKQMMWRCCSNRQQGGCLLLFKGLRWHTRDKHKQQSHFS